MGGIFLSFCVSAVMLLQNFSELNYHMFYSCTYSSLVQGRFHPVSVIGGIWSEILYQIWLFYLPVKISCFYFNTSCFSFYFVTFLLCDVIKHSVADVLYYWIQEIKNNMHTWQLITCSAREKLDPSCLLNTRKNFSLHLIIFKIVCLINVRMAKSFLSTSWSTDKAVHWFAFLSVFLW